MIRGQTLVVDGGFSLRAVMEPTDYNRRMFDDAHSAPQDATRLPPIVRADARRPERRSASSTSSAAPATRPPRSPSSAPS